MKSRKLKGLKSINQWIGQLGLALFLLVTIAPATQAQTKGFSRNPETFIEELGQHVKKVNDKGIQKTFERFEEQWLSGVYTEDQQSFAIRIAEHMMLKKFKMKPDFEQYMSTLWAAKDSTSGVSNDKFDHWIQNSYKLLKDNRRSYLKLLQVSETIFADHTIYSDKSKSWKFTDTDYKFEFKGDQVFLRLDDINLICNGPDDSIRIAETGGMCDLMKDTWKGKKGIINWARVGLPPTAAFAEFDAYDVDLTQTGFEVDTVRFRYQGVVDGIVLGSLEDRVSVRTLYKEDDNFEESYFPKFISFEDDLSIKGFTEGEIIFKGGFGMDGKRIQGRGGKDGKATFEFYYKKKLTVEAKAEVFTMDDGKIRALQSEVTLFTDSGYIYHPRVQLSYTEKDKRLALRRGQKGLEQAPFYDTDHNMEIEVDQIIWKIDEPKVDFDMIIDDEKAKFSSKNYFNEFVYERITRGDMMRYDPIERFYKYFITFRSKTLKAQNFADFVGSKKENLSYILIELANQGFIYYDPQTEVITIKDKLMNYYMNNLKLADYDVIRFNSIISARPNATLNLVNYDLKLQGVRAFEFSDSQFVIAYPKEQIVTVKNNRRLIFDGKITAGRFDFFGDRFDFSYESFTVSSEKIDSLKLWFPDTINQKYLIPVKSVLRDINGVLYIDKSNNKSGLTDYPEYPKFESRAPSLIAYDKKSIFNGAYTKEDFHFAVDPFEIDSLDNFTIAGLKFPGTFVSAGILPEFRYEASIMKDYSLGFTKANPPGGYPMYGGKGHGEIDVSLSEEGFWAKGEIEYEGAKMESSKIVMMPDSTNAEVDKYSIDRNEKYPRLLAMDVRTHWLPKEDEMYINTNEHEVDIFDDGQVFEGNLLQTPSQLSGNGELRWDNAILASTNMEFDPIHADADTSSIRIGDVDEGMISFVSTNVQSHIDFEERTGEFRANELGHLTQFPYNQFASTLDEFKWDMDAKTIELTPTGRQKQDEYLFVSQNPSQNGLKFQSTKALFDMNDGIIYAEEVPYIDIADSRVFPADGKVTIEKDAAIRPLEKAKLLANRDNKYHELYDCKLFIKGRLDIAGNGYYVYKDKYKTGQVIFFDKMRVMADTSTIQASGYISDSLDFVLSPKIGFKGTADLSSKEAFLSFKGFVKPLHTFEHIQSQWMRYMDQPDPQNVIVSAHVPKDVNRKKLAIGLSLSPSDSINVYPNFFGHKSGFTDHDIAIDTGVFYYDELSRSFVTGDSNKLLNGALRGNTISFNDEDQTIRAEGILDFGLDMHEKFSATTIGKAVRGPDDSTFVMNTMMAMDIEIPEDAWARLLVLAEEKGLENPSISVDNEGVKHNLAQLVTDDKKFNKVAEELSSFGEIKQIDELKKDLLITDVEFYYSHTLHAFVSKEPIQVATIHGKQFNKQLNARLMIENRRSANRFVLYFEFTKYDYFYFEFYRGSLFVYSTDNEFNQVLRQRAGKVNERGYTVRPGSPGKVTRLMDMTDLLDD